MRHYVGLDVGKGAHWACVLGTEGRVLLSRRVEATEEALEAFCSEIAQLGNADERVFGIDLTGGPAALLEAVLIGRNEEVRYVPGTVVNKAREAYAGGEQKSDKRDAFVIADHLRLRWEPFSEVRSREEDVAELRALVAHRRDLLVQDQTRRVTRLRELLVSVFPGLEATLDLTKKGPLCAVSRVARPAAVRRLGEARLARWLEARGVYGAKKLASRVVAAAKAQRHELPAAEAKAVLVAEIASEVLRTKERIDALEARLAELVEAHPEGKLVMSLPGMGTIMTAEFLAEAGDLSRFGSADRFAAAAGIAPVLRASGSVSYRRRAKRGNRVLKRVFYQSAHCAVLCHERSRTYYRRKRAEGKGHTQAVIALARRRVNVLWAMLRDGTFYEDRASLAA